MPYYRPFMLSLAQASSGSRFKVVSLACGRRLAWRLADLGLYIGSELAVERNDGWGPLVLVVLSSRFALGRGAAEKIYVQKI